MRGKREKPEGEEHRPQNRKNEYAVKISRRWARKLEALPLEVQDRFELLIEDLREKGPLRTEWPNYSPLANDYYHCHLYRGWVAVWEWKRESIVIRVEYVGSRGSAPYAK
jgi:hypothetical protein